MAEMTGGLVRIDRLGAPHDRVAILVLAHPPANLWTEETERQFLHALDLLEADASVAAIILRGEGRGFSAGAPLDLALDLARARGLARVTARIEACVKPVIAALHGMVLGAGAALALAAHARIAHEKAMIGLPELGLGLVPPGGATQRLPRLIGLEQAWRVMRAARPIPAAEALAIGLVDEVTSGILGQAALDLASRLAPSQALRRASQLLPPDLARLPALMGQARREAQSPSALRLADCIEAAGILPFEMGMNLEEAAFGDLAASPEAAGLVHALVCERLALQPPVETPRTDLRVVGLVGAGGFAAEAALQAVRAGLKVVLVDPDRAALTSALATVVGGLDAEVAAGRLSEAEREAAWARMAAGQGSGLPEGVDLVFEEPGAESGAQAVLGAASMGAGLTLAEGPGALSELSIGPGARPEILGRLVSFGRQLGWRMVPVGPGGPLELGLRLALEAAVEALSAVHGASVVEAALAAQGIGRPREAQARPQALVLRGVMAGLAAEGARMLEDGRARRASDIDAVAVLSGLIPREMGGPMFAADRRGLLLLRADLRKLGGASVFAVSPLIDRLVAEGGRFGA